MAALDGHRGRLLQCFLELAPHVAGRNRELRDGIPLDALVPRALILRTQGVLQHERMENVDELDAHPEQSSKKVSRWTVNLKDPQEEVDCRRDWKREL